MNNKESLGTKQWMSSERQMYSEPPGMRYQSGMDPSINQIMSMPSVFPEDYYIIQPHILMIADKIEMYEDKMPSSEMIESMCDQVYDDICRLHPEMADYDHDASQTLANDPAVETQFFPLGRQFRRRRPLRSLIQILLLNELLRRRRRRFFWDF